MVSQKSPKRLEMVCHLSSGSPFSRRLEIDVGLIPFDDIKVGGIYNRFLHILMWGA